MRILFIILLLVTTLSNADTGSALQERSVIKSKESNTIKFFKTNNSLSLVKQSKNQENHKLNLVLPKNIMAKVRKDEMVQQRDVPEAILPNLFDTGTETNFGLTGGVIKSVDTKEKGAVDGAEIQFHFKQ